MLFFQFHVLGWCNTQFVAAATETEAYRAAAKIAGGEENFYGFKQIHRKDVDGVLQCANSL